MTLLELPHVHRWRMRSRHLTSTGMVIYQQCTCGRQRLVEVDAQADTDSAPGNADIWGVARSSRSRPAAE